MHPKKFPDAQDDVDNVSLEDFDSTMNIDRSLDQKLGIAIYNFHHF